MRVLIYGGGSVGLGIASCLLRAGAEVVIVGRGKTVAVLRAGGLIRKGIFGEYFAPAGAFGSYRTLDEIQGGSFDYILVCTKSFDSFEAARDISRHRRLMNESAKIVLFQNGWGNAEVFLSFFEAERIYNARVITGFRRFEANAVEVTVHADPIHVGSLFGGDLSCVEQLCESISAGDIPCEITGEIGKDLWAKMLYNCALNPLGAVLDVPYGVLAENEFGRAVMDEVIKEVFEVMDAAGYQTHWQRAEDFLEVFYNRLVPDTAEHKSSMLQDVLAKKKTEIDALNGAVIKLGKEHNVDVPCNIALYNMVKFIEAEKMVG
jgi:2-dehydropantoate 2-reductase